VLAGWLNRLGYRVYCSGIVLNIDCPRRTAESVRLRLASIAEATQQPVTVIGHSLGGVLARFLGASDPHYVRQVIALGSPIDGSMRVHPLLPPVFKMIQHVQGLSRRSLPPCGENVRCSCHFVIKTLAPLPAEVQFAAIYSKQDEIVDWRACIDAARESYEVRGQHLGLIVNAEVYRLLGRLLVPHSTSEGVPTKDNQPRLPAAPPPRFSIAADICEAANTNPVGEYKSAEI
jgi:pimeloyl-ACP methyl ester carboxylesterase